MKKKFLLTAALSAAVLGLASCNDGNAPTGGEPEKVTLNTMSMFGGTDPHAKAYEQFIKDFEAANSNVTVKDNSATSDEIWKTSVISSFYTGNEPDVLFYFTGNVAKPLVDNKKVVSINDIRKEYPDYAKNVSDSVIDPYAVTLKGFVEGMFVNTKLLKENGLTTYADKDVWTWDDFMAVSDGLKAKKKTPVAFGSTDEPHYWIEHLILGCNGKEAYQAIPSEADFKDYENKPAAKGWVDALAMMKDLKDAGVFGQSGGDRAAALAKQEFLDGNAGMYLDGSWFAGQVGGDKSTITQNDVKMIPFPAIPTAKGGKNKVYMQSGFTSGFYITKKAWDNPAKRDLAVKFVQQMTSTAAIKEFCKVGGVPADSSVKLDGLTPLGNSMNTMAGRTQEATLPLGDAAKAQTFGTLVTGASYYLAGNKPEIAKVLADFAKKQK